MDLALLHLDFSTCFDRLRVFIDRHNENTTEKSEQIPNAMRATAETMLRLYLKQVSGKVRIAPGSTDLPGFDTNNEAIAKLRGCTARTIINHRKRLVNAGLITHEHIRLHKGIRIWFHPSLTARYLLEMPSSTSQKNEGSGHPEEIATMKNFQGLVHEHHELKNKNSNVDKWIKNWEDEKKIMNTKETGLGEEKTQKGNPHPSCSLLWMVENFWLRAKKALYPHESFDAERTRAILNFIWETVYLKFQGDRDWDKLHKIAIRRLGMVHRWLHRKPNRWVPIAEIYFDPLNKTNSFANTWKWYLKAITLQQKLSTQVTMKKYVIEWQSLDRGEGNQRPVQLLRRQQQQIESQPEPIKTAYLKLLNERINHLDHGNTS